MISVCQRRIDRWCFRSHRLWSVSNSTWNTNGQTDKRTKRHVRLFVWLSVCPLCLQGRPTYRCTKRDAS